MFIRKIISEKKEIQKKKVFLGGTCNGSKWRDKIIPKLKIDYFNPVVNDWTLEHQKEELKQRKICDYCLYVITPKLKGVYSIAEVIDDSNKNPKKTIFCVLNKDENKEFDNASLKSLNSVSSMVVKNGGTSFNNLEDVINFLNK